MTEGAKITTGQLKRYIPVFQEGAVDEDLLNEGRRNLQDYLQTEGYYDAKVSVQEVREDGAVKIVYQVDRGVRHSLFGIKIEGNKYFDAQTIRERLSLQPASWTQPHGRFSQAILAVDVLAIKNLYVANGFPNVEVTGNVVATTKAIRNACSSISGSWKGSRCWCGASPSPATRPFRRSCSNAIFTSCRASRIQR